MCIRDRAKPIGRDIEANDTQLHYGSGYDHNFAIDKTAPGVEKVATAYSPESLSLIHIFKSRNERNPYL